jgi:hypothetical protein
MTTIACWFNKESSQHSIWVCGDSKISNQTSTLLESGAKIFSIPVLCLSTSDSGFFDKPIYYTTLGLAYAGSSLIGLNLNAALSTCLSKLNTLGKPPSLNDIAAFACSLLHLYVSQLSFSAGSNALCEIAIIGYCPLENKLKIYHLEPQLGVSEFHYKITAHSISDSEDSFVLLLGCDKDRISAQIASQRSEQKNIAWWREPKKVIEAEVSSSENPKIGGHTQLGICDQFGFQVYSLCRPHQLEQSPAYLSYLGFDVTADIGKIGECYIGMPGMYKWSYQLSIFL